MLHRKGRRNNSEAHRRTHPTFATGGTAYPKRLTLAISDGRIERVYYPVQLPEAHARQVWHGSA
jgi:hypothetical protein